MKKINKPALAGATVLTTLQMNAIHFGGIHTPLTPDQLKALSEKDKG